MPRPIAVVALLGALACLAQCATPTAIVVEVFSEVDCSVGATVALVGGKSLQALEGRAPSATSTTCTPEGAINRMGRVVLVPAGARDEPVAFAFATRVDRGDPAGCLSGTTKGCIVARRQLRFSPRTGLTMRIDLRTACLDVVCDPTSTCEDGVCVPADQPACPACASDAGAMPDAAPPAPTSPPIVAVGGAHACAVAGARVLCWGLATEGQLGTGSIGTASAVPVQVAGLPAFLPELALGKGHGCVVGATSGVFCWGANGLAQVGLGKSPQLTPIANGQGPAKRVAAGGSHSCLLTEKGVAQCWGANDVGQLGRMPSAMADPTPRAITYDLVPLLALSAGGAHTCALTSGLQIVCWGSSSRNQIGIGVGEGLTGTVPLLGPHDAPCAGALHSCAIETAAGSVDCWGDNESGQLGVSRNAMGMSGPVRAQVGTGATALACGQEHTCALFEKGEVRCWGSNTSSQLGGGDPMQVGPALVKLPRPALRIAAGGRSACAVLDDARVFCWGANDAGQCGVPPSLSVPPTQVPGL